MMFAKMMMTAATTATSTAQYIEWWLWKFEPFRNDESEGQTNGEYNKNDRCKNWTGQTHLVGVARVNGVKIALNHDTGFAAAIIIKAIIVVRI